MKPCGAHSLEELADLAGGRLDGAAAEALRRHLDACASCREAAARLAALDAALRRSEAMQTPAVPEADRRRIVDGARQMLADEAEAGSATRRSGVAARFWNRPEVRRALAAAAVLAVVAAAGLLAVRSARSTLGPAVARAVAMRGSVTVGGNGGSPLSGQQTLHVGQRIRTGRGAMLTLAMTGGGSMDVNEGAALVIERSDAAETLCRLDQGQVFVSLGSPGGAGRMVLDTSVARVEATAAEFDVHLAAGSLAGGRLRRGGPFVLAAATVQVLGEPAMPSELRLTVVSGEVTLSVAGDPTPVVVRANEQVRYDPRGARPVPVKVRAEEHVLWRLPDDRVSHLASAHWADLFSAKVTPQQQGRIRLDYDFVSGRELDDWRIDGAGWALMLNALRCRNGQGAIVSRAAFVGDVEVALTANMERRDGTQVGWELRPATAGGFDVVTATAAWADPGPSLRMSLAFGDGGSPQAVMERDAGQVFGFGGRLEGDRVLVSLDDRDLIESAAPDAMLKALHDPTSPQPLHVAVRAGGEDLFITHLTVIGRPDPRWLRQRLQQVVGERPSGR
ncbi:MAG TPA: zf-HC2 domain-containing protein [Phycisphaerae bacterium]|nr:hypothetical protein [Phycisphaerae bacterium]HOI56022.1 zf-HC2 domain-containing protein [Phycisphaerae bacterium]